MAHADSKERQIIEDLLAQAKHQIMAMVPATEEDIVKLIHAHLFHCIEEIFSRSSKTSLLKLSIRSWPWCQPPIVKLIHAYLFHCIEEIFGRLPILGPGIRFRSLAQHETTCVEHGQVLEVMRRDKDDGIEVIRGPARVRPDNIYVVTRNHEDTEPVRFEDTKNAQVSSILEVKGPAKVPVTICQNVVQKSNDDFNEHWANSRSESLPTPSDLEDWERRRLEDLTLWQLRGSSDDEDGFGKAKEWAQQSTAYAVCHNTPCVIGFDYRGLVLLKYHRLERYAAIDERWKFGRRVNAYGSSIDRAGSSTGQVHQLGRTIDWAGPSTGQVHRPGRFVDQAGSSTGQVNRRD